MIVGVSVGIPSMLPEGIDGGVGEGSREAWFQINFAQDNTWIQDGL